MSDRNLTVSASAILDSAGAGQVTLGPDTAGGAVWNVDGVIVQTSRPGLAPIPRCQVFLDSTDPGGAQGLTYDGSFSQGRVSLTVTRGQHLIAVWTGGQAGDVASMTLTGTRQ